jgi:AspT/YidE/YbjL antiporter-like protein
MDTIKWMVSTAPEIFLLLTIALGTMIGRMRIGGFSIGTTACTLIVAVIIGQLGNFVIPPLFKSVFCSLFVFTIGYKSGPEFFASLSLRTLTQVGLAVVVGMTGLSLVLAFAFTFHLDAGTASGLAAGALTQSSMIGTSSGALAQLGLTDDVLRQQQANIAAGYAVTYILGYILTLLFVPFVAPWLMGIDLKEEAAKLEAVLSGGKAAPKKEISSEIKRRGRRSARWRIALASVVAERSSVTTMMSTREGKLFSKPAMKSSRRTVDNSCPGGSFDRAEIEGAEVLREVQGERSASSSTPSAAWTYP